MAPYRWRTAAQNAEILAQQERWHGLAREYHRRCYQVAHWIGPNAKAIAQCDPGRLSTEGATLLSMTAYCLDRQD